jgi:hypothetical protein
MKSIALVAIVGVFLLLPGDRAVRLSAQSTLSPEVEYKSAYATGPGAVIVNRNGALLTRLEIPKGASLSIYAKNGTRIMHPGAFAEFHGDVVIRVRPEREIDLSKESRFSQAIMAMAPLVMTVEGADVVFQHSQGQ